MGSLVQVTLAWAIPSIWALVLGLLVAAAFSTIASYFLMDWRTLRFKVDKNSAKELFLYGRWIFISSVIFFLSMNFDRLFFAKVISLSSLGLFGIARTFSETILNFFVRFCQLIAFPMISAAEKRGSDLRLAIRPIRFMVLFVLAFSLGLFVAIADEFIGLIYDARYGSAGIILTVLMFGTWFAVLAAMADAMMMGIGKPAGVAAANGMKLLFIVVALPLAVRNFGFAASLGVLAFAELVRYAALVVTKRHAGLGFSRQDLLMTLLFIVLTCVFREALSMTGLTRGLSGWLEQLRALNV